MLLKIKKKFFVSVLWRPSQMRPSMRSCNNPFGPVARARRDSSCPGRNLGLGRESHLPPGPHLGPFLSGRQSEGELIQWPRVHIGRSKSPNDGCPKTLISFASPPLLLSAAQNNSVGHVGWKEKAAPPHGPCWCARSPSWLSAPPSRGRTTVP
jgi:hypothetical protein